jgi:hypothetical protein
LFDQGGKLRQKYIDADKAQAQQPLAGIATLLESEGDMAAFFAGLAKHSPNDIQADVEALAHAFQNQQDHLGDAISSRYNFTCRVA